MSNETIRDALGRIEKGYVRTTEGQVHYRRLPAKGRPPVAFFHQTASSSAMFDQVMARLADRYDMVAFDTPGFGGSYEPADIPSVRYLADALWEAVENLQLEPLHLVGHHTGGCIALEMAVHQQPQVRSLTIIGAVLATAEERAEYRKKFSAPYSPDPDGEYLKVAWDYLASIGAAVSVDVHNREMVDHLRAWRALPMTFNAVWDQDFESLYRAVDVPLMNICSRDDVLWPFHERALEMRPDSSAATVHGMDWQCDRDPDGMAAAIHGFLARQA